MPVVVKVILVGSVAHRIIQMAKGIKGAAQVSDTHQEASKKSSKPGTSPLVPVFGSYGSMLFTKWLDPMMKSKESP